MMDFTPGMIFSQLSMCRFSVTRLKMTASEQVISDVRSMAIAPGA